MTSRLETGNSWTFFYGVFPEWDGWLRKGDGCLNEEDGWLSEGDGWLSEGDGWLSEGDGWLSEGNGWQNYGDGWLCFIKLSLFFLYGRMFSMSVSGWEVYTAHFSPALGWEEVHSSLNTGWEDMHSPFNNGWEGNLSDFGWNDIHSVSDSGWQDTPPPPLSFWMRKFAICHSRVVCTLPLYSRWEVFALLIMISLPVLKWQSSGGGKGAWQPRKLQIKGSTALYTVRTNASCHSLLQKKGKNDDFILIDWRLITSNAV